MRLPSRQECLQMFDAYLVPRIVYRHCWKVSRAGVALAEAIKQQGIAVDVFLVEIGCLLHDMMKIYSLDSLEPKPHIGYFGPTPEQLHLWQKLRPQFEGLHETIILREVLKPDYPEFAQFISLIGSTGNPTYLDGPIELKIMHYVDWRIEGDYVVPFSERLDYLGETYRHKWLEHGHGWWDRMAEKELVLESELFEPLNMSPKDLARLIIHHVKDAHEHSDNLEQSIKYAADVLRNGGVVVYPAKNGYMIGVNPFDEWALGKVYKMKKRPVDQYLACVVSDVEMAEKYTSLSAQEKLITHDLMPGPILLVGNRKPTSPGLPDTLSREGFTFTIARSKIARMLLEQMRQPIVATSCNIHGHPASLCVDEIDLHILNFTDVIFNVGEMPYQPDYSVFRFVKEDLVVKREGLVDVQDIHSILSAKSAAANSARFVSGVRERISVLEEILAVMTLDVRVAELWLRRRSASHSSDLGIVIVAKPEYMHQLYTEGANLFSCRFFRVRDLGEKSMELGFEFDHDTRADIRYAVDGAYLDADEYERVWARV